MRKNLSEELKINDDIVLNDGSEAKEEEDKKAKEVEKEVQKELDSKNKIAKEVVNAKTPDAKANNSMGKSTKIKQFVEKLTLEEPSDVLNEDVEDMKSSDDEDRYYDLYFDLVSDIYRLLVNFAHKALDIQYVRDQDIPIDFVREQAESSCEEALMHFDDEA